MRALVVIDYTNDFVIGKLPCGDPAIAIEHRIVSITKQFIDDNEFVVMAVDVHDESDIYHPEHRLFPPHNLRGTDGRKLCGQLDEMFELNRGSIHWMDKTRYSAFCGTDLEIKLSERGILEIHLVGVCTDICVLHTAIEAYNKGFQIIIHEDAVASFQSEAHQWALHHMRHVLGATIVRNNEPIKD